MRMEQRDASGIVQYFWSAIIGTERSIGFGRSQICDRNKIRNDRRAGLDEVPLAP